MSKFEKRLRKFLTMETTVNRPTSSKQQLSLKSYVTVNNKKYSYVLRPYDEESTWVDCEAACISQSFLREDVPELLMDLPNLIVAVKKFKKDQENVIRFRVSNEDKKAIQKQAAKKGYKSISSYLRDLALRD